MYNVNDVVVYGARGVCRIVDVKENIILGEVVKYYVLVPVFGDNLTISIPVDNEALTSKMRAVKTHDEIDEIMDSLPTEEVIWIENESRRAKAYQDILITGNANDIAALVKTLFVHRGQLISAGKKPHKSDEVFLKDAKKALYDEFALGLGIDREQVEGYVLEKMNV